MWKCPECGAIFEEPNYMEICWEDYCGVSSMFPDRHYGTVAECPECGHCIDIEYDIYDEDEEEEYDEFEE